MKTEFSTTVKLNLDTLRRVVDEYTDDYRNAPTGSNKSRWANSKALLARTDFAGESFKTIKVISAAAGNTIRLYNTPSMTSYPKNVRKAIVPMREGDSFLFFDVKSAEYMYMAFQAGATRIIERYKNGEDVYQVSSRVLKNIPRERLKTVMIASLYDAQPYSAAKVLGCSEYEAEYVIEAIHDHHPEITDLMNEVSNTAFRTGMYYFTKGIDSMEKVLMRPKVDKKHDGTPTKAGALSCFGQSGFAYIFNKALECIGRPEEITTLPVFDAMLVECAPDEVAGLRDKLKVLMSPFILEFREGKTFYEAYMKP